MRRLSLPVFIAVSTTGFTAEVVEAKKGGVKKAVEVPEVVITATRSEFRRQALERRESAERQLAAVEQELTKARAEMVVNCVFDAMTQALQRGEGIEIRGFGSFTVRPYKPYDGRNPRTGQPVPVPAKRLPFFKVGKELKELVNASRERELEARRQAGEAGELPLRDDSDDDD